MRRGGSRCPCVSPDAFMARDEKGMALVATLALLPLLIAVAGALTAGLMALRAHRESLHACRTALLDSQSRLAEGWSQLRLLNPAADALRLSAREAQAEIAAAPDPVTRSAAIARLAAIRARQFALDARQRAIIAIANLGARLEFERARAGSAAAFAKAAKAFDGRGAGVARAVGVAPKLPVEPRPPGELAPRYVPVSAEPARLRWTARISEILPAWIPVSIDSARAFAEGECAATAQRSEATWTPRLVEGRR